MHVYIQTHMHSISFSFDSVDIYNWHTFGNKFESHILGSKLILCELMLHSWCDYQIKLPESALD